MELNRIGLGALLPPVRRPDTAAVVEEARLEAILADRQADYDKKEAAKVAAWADANHAKVEAIRKRVLAERLTVERNQALNLLSEVMMSLKRLRGLEHLNELVEYFRNTIMQEVQNALLFERAEPTDLPEFKGAEETSVPATVAPTPEPFGMAKVMPNVPRIPDGGEMDGGLPYTMNAKLFFKVAAAGGQEAFIAKTEGVTVEEEKFAGALLKYYKQGGKVFRIETWRDGSPEAITDGNNRPLNKLAKRAAEAHSGALAKVFATGDDRDVIDHRSIQAYVPR